MSDTVGYNVIIEYTVVKIGVESSWKWGAPTLNRTPNRPRRHSNHHHAAASTVSARKSMCMRTSPARVPGTDAAVSTNRSTALLRFCNNACVIDQQQLVLHNPSNHTSSATDIPCPWCAAAALFQTASAVPADGPRLLGILVIVASETKGVHGSRPR